MTPKKVAVRVADDVELPVHESGTKNEVLGLLLIANKYSKTSLD